MPCWALFCYLDFTFSAQGWGGSYGVALAVPLALWISFFFFFWLKALPKKKKKSTSPKEHWNQSQIIWNSWPVQRKKRISEPKSLHLFNTSQDSTPKCILCKNNSDQVLARAKTIDQEDVDYSGPQNTFWENKITFDIFCGQVIQIITFRSLLGEVSLSVGLGCVFPELKPTSGIKT